jgi:hypothetical protein
MRRLATLTVLLSAIIGLAGLGSASNHYTNRQMDALAERVGSSYWIHAPAGKGPLFLSVPAANAKSFQPADNESFEISELVGRASKNPYYKVTFQSGRVAYLRPEVFNEEINGSIVVGDPRADEKRKSEQAAQAEKQRLEWIDAQPWPASVKQAAIKKQPLPGLNGAEVTQILGAPRRVVKAAGPTKLRGATQAHEERWYYADGMVLLFRNSILTQVDHPAK